MPVQEISDQNFDAEVLKEKLPVLVDVWAPWCGPCRMISPIVERISDKFTGRLKTCKLNADENQKTPASFQITGIPTLLLFKEGNLIDRIVGYQPEEQISSKIEKIC
jgi:thioredoxin 1